MTKPQHTTTTVDASLSFEQALAELEGIVRKLEQGELPLEDAIEQFARGNSLRSHCEEKLNDARLRVEKIVKQPDGSPEPVPTTEFITTNTVE